MQLESHIQSCSCSSSSRSFSLVPWTYLCSMGRRPLVPQIHQRCSYWGVTPQTSARFHVVFSDVFELPNAPQWCERTRLFVWIRRTSSQLKAMQDCRQLPVGKCSAADRISFLRGNRTTVAEAWDREGEIPMRDSSKRPRGRPPATDTSSDTLRRIVHWIRWMVGKSQSSRNPFQHQGRCDPD